MSSRSQPSGAVTVSTRRSSVAAWWSDKDDSWPLALAWLGQAGFAIRCYEHRLLIDPYLSNFLGEKYRGREFPHVRMMPPPIAAGKLRPLDTVLCTHRHSDHMDPGTLPVLAAANPGCRFVVPRADAETAVSRGIEAQRLILLDVGQSHELAEGLSVTATPAAHETVEVDSKGHHRFLGYILRTGNYCLYHSGDTVPFEGLAEALSSHSIDMALLPVNGRDAFRRQRGVPGNMTFAEAADLCRQLKIAALVPHHFEMFDFNTVDREHLRRQVASCTSCLKIVLPETGVIIQVAREGDDDESRN